MERKASCFSIYRLVKKNLSGNLHAPSNGEF